MYIDMGGFALYTVGALVMLVLIDPFLALATSAPLLAMVLVMQRLRR